MDSQRWRQLNDLFAAALERPAAERSPFLAGACGEDLGLRGEVESLLAAHEEAGDFIETPALQGLAGLEASEPADDLAAGSRLGPYEVVALLGAGGMGRVYRARDPRLGREVAIKVLPHRALGDRTQLARFTREARAAGSLNHPNLLAVYDVGTETASPYVVTELLEGETLLERLRLGPLPVERAVDFGRQIAAGLAAAHAKGVVHRDLKPANLFVTLDGRLKILDFGLAKQTGAEGGAPASGATRPGMVLGTVGYMSPEQVRGHPVDLRSDIFSFGAVLYEMLSGRRAFSGDSAVETMNAILSHEPPGLAAAGCAVPPAVERLVWSCLRKTPEERFPSARELTAALEASSSAPSPAEPSTLIAPARAAIREGRLPMIAVLPFVNLSAEPDQDYFCEGMADELIRALGQLHGLRILARMSAAQLRARGEELRRIGERLGVEKVIEGSVRKSGGLLRISVQLVNLADGAHLWSGKYDREPRDVFALQDEIADRVVEALRGRLVVSAPPGGPRVRRYTADLEAYHLYLRGRYHWNKRHEGGLLEAVRCFEQAIERDPAYAPAYAGLADTYALMGQSIYDLLPPREALPRARAAALKALEIDEGLAEPHACLGWIKLHYDWDWNGARESFERSLALDPDRATTRHWYSFLLSAQGEREAAQREAERAWELDPLSLIVNANLIQPDYYSHRFDRAIVEGEKLVRMEPGFAISHYWLGVAYIAAGRYREAVPELRAFSASGGGETRGPALVGYALGRAGDRSAALELRDQLLAAAGRRYVPAFHLALVHIGLGDLDAACADLERAYAERSDQLAYLKVEPLFDPLRSDPRFEALLHRLWPPASGPAAPRDAPQAAPGLRRRAIAVLPFQGIAADPADAHLGLGLADATITELAQIRSLTVRPTSTILRFAPAVSDPVEAGRELQVDTVVEGTFQRQGDRLRISVRLLSVADRQALWGTKIDTSFDDLFRIQDEVSHAIARALAIELPPSGERRREGARRGEEPAGEAYELVLKGRVHLFGETLEEWLKAVDCFDRACVLEPNSAPAWAGLADVYSRIAFTYLPEGDWYARAWAACEKALALDPHLPEALYVRGGRLLWSPQAGFDHAGAMRDLVPAIAARPALEEAHCRLGSILHHVGLIDECEYELNEALLISPEHLLATQHQGLCLYTRGRFQEALDLYQAVDQRAPSPWVRYQVALCQLRLARLDDGAQTIALMERTPREIMTFPLRALLAALRGDRAAALHAVDQTISNKRQFGHYHHAQYDLACVHALLGDADEAVTWLTAAARNGFPCAPQFKGDSFLAALANHEGFVRLLSELEEQSQSYAALFRDLRAAI